MMTPSKVAFAKRAPFPRKVAKKACIREGLQFEAEVQIALDKRLPVGGKAYHSKWISFVHDGSLRHAQPDTFVVFADRVVIFEMKLRHTPNSAAQLVKYGELLAVLYPGKAIQLCEVYKYWDWICYPAPSKQIAVEEMFKVVEGKVTLLAGLDL